MLFRSLIFQNKNVTLHGISELSALVCTTTTNNHVNHKELKNYADYGLEFRFSLATEKYLQGDRDTDEHLCLQKSSCLYQSVGGLPSGIDNKCAFELYGMRE